MAVNVFKTLVSHGYRPNDVTCNIMIDCCSISGSYKSAQGLIAMMIRSGYPPYTQAYTALIKVFLNPNAIYNIYIQRYSYMSVSLYMHV